MHINKNIPIASAIVVILAFSFEIGRIIVTMKHSIFYWSTQRRSQFTAYIFAILFTIVQTLYTHWGIELDELEFNSGVVPIAPTKQVIAKCLSLTLFYFVYLITMYACLHRFVRLYPLNYPSRFIFMILGGYSTLVILHLIYEFWIDFSVYNGCIWSTMQIPFCRDFGHPLSRAIQFTVAFIFPIFEIISNVILIRVFLNINVNCDDEKLVSRYRKQKIFLFSHCLFILVLDIITAIIYTRKDFSVRRIALSLSIIHVFVSFSFLSNLNSAIKFANTLTTFNTAKFSSIA